MQGTNVCVENNSALVDDRPTRIDTALNKVEGACRRLEKFVDMLEGNETPQLVEAAKSLVASGLPSFQVVYDTIIPRCDEYTERFDSSLQRLRKLLIEG
jgi:hypothetical protein